MLVRVVPENGTFWLRARIQRCWDLIHLTSVTHSKGLGDASVSMLSSPGQQQEANRALQ